MDDIGNTLNEADPIKI